MQAMTKLKNKEAMLAISAGFLLLYLIFSLKWMVITAFIAGLIGVFSSWLSGKVAWIWYGLARILGTIVNIILLSVIYFFFLTPIALLFRIFNKDPLMLKKNYPSYFITRDITFSRDSFEKPW